MEITANILLVGPTRSGKDSFINTISQKTVAQEGVHNFQSTTKEPQKYVIDLFNKKSLVINTQGFGDTSADQSDQQIGEITELFILQESNMNKIDLILLFEPLDSDVLQTKLTYSNLIKIFGEQIQKSVIVICSKIDKCIKIGDYDDRKNIEDQISQDLQLPILYWQNDTLKQKIEDVQRQIQMEDLRNKFLKIIPYHIPSLNQKRDRIKNRAIQLMNNAPDVYVPYTYEVTVEVPYTFPHTYEVTVQVPYQEVEYYMEAVKRTIKVPKKRTVQVLSRRRYGQSRIDYSQNPTYENRVEHYTEDKDVIEEVNKSRNITKYKPEKQSITENITKQITQQQIKTDQIKMDKDINLFMIQAKEQILQEMWKNVKKTQK